MIQETYLKAILEPVIRDKQLLLVDMHVTPQNRITVVIDSLKGVTIEDCAMVNRFIEEHLDRDTEDFHLEVTSPGADQPLKFREQYQKHLGRQMQIELLTGKIITGILEEITEDGVVLHEILSHGKKKKNTGKETDMIPVAWDEIKQGKVIISFK